MLALATRIVIPVVSINRCHADDFPEVYNNEADKDAEPMDASLAAKTMRLPAGFSATVFASEPDVRNPIAMAWDDRQRMWVAENYTYSDRTQHFDLALRDRVIILNDSDGDGHAEQRSVFLDNVQMLTSVEVGRGGVWLMCPPQLLFVPDANGDDVPDGPPEVVLDGFTVAQANYHNFANGLRWGPDGWLYGRCGHSCPGEIGRPGTPDDQRIPIDGGIWRYHPEWKTVEVLTHGTVNPWGHDWDKNGELFFINTVIGHLWHCIPGAHFIESFGESPNPLVYERLDMIADHYHYDRNGSWTESRDGAANALGGGHAHIGMMVYQGKRWPTEYHNKLFTLNMHGLRCNVETLEREGAGYVGRHNPDFLICQDPFFRGIEISTGPDGDAYVLDWSDTGECHDHSGVHRTSGRIYKIHYDGSEATNNASPRAFTKPACLAGDGKLPQLWKRYLAGDLTTDQLHESLRDPDEHVRVWAIRLLTDRWPLDTFRGPQPDAVYPDQPATIESFRQLAKDDPSGLVLLALASTLQRLPVDQRLSLAQPLLSRDEFASDRDLPAMIWFGLMPVANQFPDQLAIAAATCDYPVVTKWMTRALASQADENLAPLETVLAKATSFSHEKQLAVLNGLSEAFKGWHKAPEPASWKAFSQSTAARDNPDAVRELDLLFGDGRALDELRQIVRSNAPLQTRKSALESLIKAKPDDLRRTCESLLDQREINAVAARGLSQFDDPKVGERLAQMYRRFQPNDRPGLIEILVSRPSFANALLDRIDADRNPIPRGDVTAFHARQILGFSDPILSEKLAQRWGTLRDSPADRRQAIDAMKASMTPNVLADADVTQGRTLFNKTCSQCHRLFGEGESIGPDLTGAQRSSLDYLLENILDPSAVVGKDHRMSIVLLDDGRVFNGLIVSQNDKTLVIQTQTRKETLSQDAVEQIRITPLSPMPDGLLTTLSDDQIRDLIGYLMSPTQVSLP